MKDKTDAKTIMEELAEVKEREKKQHYSGIVANRKLII